MTSISSQNDNGWSASRQSRYAVSTAATVATDLHVIKHGAVVYCDTGEADIVVNFDSWHINTDNVLTLFPGDTVRWTAVSPDFSIEILRYDANLLREASMQMEHAIYSLLRQHRVCADAHISQCVTGSMMRMLRYYFCEQHCESIDRIVVLQLTTFFLGFYDYIRLQPQTQERDVSQRVNELFNRFMELIEHEYNVSHEVKYYADKLSITPKYLSIIVNQKTGLTPKKVIDEYVVLQIKLQLHTTSLTVRQLTDAFHFTDPSFFIRYFKAHTGLSPQAYRKSIN